MSALRSVLAAVAALALATAAAGAGCGGPEFTSDGDDRTDGSGDPGSGSGNQGNQGSGAGDPGPGSTATSGPGGAGPTCDAPDNNECNACMLEACPKTACDCWETAACPALFACYPMACTKGVDPVDCTTYCMSLHKAGVSLAALTRDCAATHCAEQCPWAPGGELGGCEKCAYTMCASAMNACLSNIKCHKYLPCASDCSDAPCLDGCVAQSGADAPSLALADQVAACVAQQCPACS
jgi:hypothetical protein